MKVTAFAFGLAVALSACTSSAPSQVDVGQQTAGGASFDSGLNLYRTSSGLVALQSNRALEQAAMAHAADMERRGYFSHQSIGGPNGVSFQDRAQSAGCDLRAGAENIAQGQRSEAQVLEAWLASPGHRANMSVPGYTQYGLGRSGNTWVLKLAARC